MVPELIEVELYRRLATQVVGRRITSVRASDSYYLKGGVTAPILRRVMVGASIQAARRIGKLVLLDLGPTAPISNRDRSAQCALATIGIRFGMTGRLVLNGRAGVDQLIYAPRRQQPEWDRFVIALAGGGRLAVSDPRRLGGVQLNPNEAELGPDAASVSLADLRRALTSSRVALKARIMDQRRLAGVGNLMADEILWRAALSPLRSAQSLSRAEVGRLHRHLLRTISDLGVRGGSHLGDMTSFRRSGMACPRDGTELVRSVVGGRTTWSCPYHQI